MNNDHDQAATEVRSASAIDPEPSPRCPTCNEAMPYYGGSAGWICHDFKILVRADGWFDGQGDHVRDRRLTDQTVRGIQRRG